MTERVLLSVEGEWNFVVDLVSRDTEALEANLVSQAVGPVVLHVGEDNSVMGSLGARDTGMYVAKLEFEDSTSEDWVLLRAIVNSEEALSSKVLLNGGELFLGSVGLSEVLNSLAISREETDSSTVFRSHVRDSSSVSNGEGSNTRSEEFNESADDTTLSEHLSDGEDEISSSGGLWELTSELESDNFGENHGDWLSEHDGFTFDTTDTPTDDTETIDHGGVRVSSDN